MILHAQQFSEGFGGSFNVDVDGPNFVVGAIAVGVAFWLWGKMR